MRTLDESIINRNYAAIRAAKISGGERLCRVLEHSGMSGRQARTVSTILSNELKHDCSVDARGLLDRVIERYEETVDNGATSRSVHVFAIRQLHLFERVREGLI